MYHIASFSSCVNELIDESVVFLKGSPTGQSVHQVSHRGWAAGHQHDVVLFGLFITFLQHCHVLGAVYNGCSPSEF